MMSEAYFVGRYELIQWINSFLKLNIRKVEECASGAIHCQVRAVHTVCVLCSSLFSTVRMPDIRRFVSREDADEQSQFRSQA